MIYSRYNIQAITINPFRINLETKQTVQQIHSNGEISKWLALDDTPEVVFEGKVLLLWSPVK